MRATPKTLEDWRQLAEHRLDLLQDLRSEHSHLNGRFGGHAGTIATLNEQLAERDQECSRLADQVEMQQRELEELGRALSAARSAFAAVREVREASEETS